MKFDPQREVRFAVVMYGGVSLAIYINGVAQELLNMVRATAPKDPGSDRPLLDDNDPELLLGTARVYRKLGQYLEDRVKLEQAAKPDNDSKAQPPSPDSIRTRFVVDVISGTSAGGINGVFLAKALARTQKMEGLKKLWLQEGDLSKLLNDSLSVSDLTGFTVQKPQQSLLNSQRMYRKLLEALAQMEKREERGHPDPEKEPSPLVGELDLFITTTDIEGIPLPIKLSDAIVYERRYKNVFHFRYATKDATGSERDDFKRSNDPFLAFAARCTSSFPFAFEPMCLADIDSVIQRDPRYRDAAKDPETWDRFFSEYLRLGLYDLDKKARGDPTLGLPSDKIKVATDKLRTAFRTRSFGDGGYLDNKPFSYATSMLMRRNADVLVDRKLLYVEPSPEHPEVVPENRARPDVVENVRAALLDLPRQETIREDIDRIDERNQMIERVTIFATGMDRDLRDPGRRQDPLDDTAFRLSGLAEMFERYGIGYGSYHRLRVEQTTRFLTDIVARIAGHDPASDAAGAIKEIIKEWRSQTYAEEKDQSGKQTENLFLSEFDLDYRLRRLAFLSRRVNELGRVDESGHLDKKALELLKIWKESSPGVDVDLTDLSPEWCEAFRRELNRIKKKVIGWALIDTRLAEEKLLRGSDQIEPETLSAERVATQSERDRIAYRAWKDAENLSKNEIEQLSKEKKSDLLDLYFATRLQALVERFHLAWSKMEELLECEEEERSQAIKKLLETNDRTKTLRLLRDNISAAFENRGSAKIKELLEKLGTEAIPGSKVPSKDELAASVAARQCLIHYYDNFTYYDLVMYPVQYGTGVGEANVVEIFRVSPEDATSLINERAAGETRRKLAGTALMSFGAFIDRGWRKNDMLWGRLDGAERLITALLPPTPNPPDPNEETRNNLIKEAHIAILREEIHEGDIETLRLLLSNMLAQVEPSSVQERKLREVVDAALIQDRKALPTAFESALRECLKSPEAIWTFYKMQFEVNRRFDPENSLRLISRATNITGRMLEGLANQIGSDPAKRAAGWIARFGTIFWGMVTVAVPQSLGNLFVRHWLGLLYLLSFITIVLGIVFPGTPIKEVGWAALGIAVAFNLLLFLLGDFISGRRGWLRALGGLLVLILAALIGFGVNSVAGKLGRFVTVNHRLLAGVAAGVLLIVFTIKEWIKGLEVFLAAPHASFNLRRLFGLSFAAVLICVWLQRIGPNNIVDLEFAGDIQTAKNLVGNTEKLRKNLFIDYLFIVAYTATLASYCVAAAKLFWQGITQLERERRKKQIDAERQRAIAPDAKIRAQTAEPSMWARVTDWAEWNLPSLTQVSHWLVIAGFSLAALQCLAGFADAAENAGLLWFLNDQRQQTGLTISLYCATLKFGLIGLGAVYSFLGFGLGVFERYERDPVDWKERLYRVGRRLLLLGFAAINAVVAVAAFYALWKHPVLLRDLFAKLFAMFM